MSELIENQENNIRDLIYEIRGKQVLLDFDLAKLYKCTNGTKDINKAVKRNIERFPEDFYFRLTDSEYKNILRFQNGTLELKQGKYSKYLPYAFTEEGAAMLASVLHTEITKKVSVDIMRAFVLMRKYISKDIIKLNNVYDMLLEHDKNIKCLEESFEKLKENKKVNEIYFNGQIYDAYSKIIDIFKCCKKELIVIDSYADKKFLDLISNINVNVILITNI